MLHYIPRHVSNINMPIFRRTNRIITASGIVTLCKWLFSMPDESRMQSISGKKIEYMKAKIDELETNSKIKNIRDL